MCLKSTAGARMGQKTVQCLMENMETTGGPINPPATAHSCNIRVSAGWIAMVGCPLTISGRMSSVQAEVMMKN